MSASESTIDRGGELVWDLEERGTAISSRGTPLVLGGSDGWQPDLLVGAAAAASVMTTFLAASAKQGIDVRGYVSRFSTGAPGARCLSLHACVVVASAVDETRARAAFEVAVATAPIADLLCRPLTFDIRVNVVADPTESLAAT